MRAQAHRGWQLERRQTGEGIAPGSLLDGGTLAGEHDSRHLLAVFARQGGEPAELAIDYLCRVLGSSNPSLREHAKKELIGLSHPGLVACLVRALDDPKLRQPIEEVLRAVDTPEARDALGLGREKE